MTLNFDQYAHTGKEFLKKVAFELGDEDDTSRASRLLRATLRALRDQSSPEESLQMISQLPMFIKALYVDGWRPGGAKNHARHLVGFVTRVEENGGFAGDSSLSLTEQLADIQSVIRVMKEYVSEGEAADFVHSLPEELRVLFDT